MISGHDCQYTLFLASNQHKLTHDSPKYCGSGVTLKLQTLTERASRWRLENSVSALNVRKGTANLNGLLWEKMSQGARDANSTRELRKRSKEEQQEARQGNAGKHAANAGGWARPKEGDGVAEEDFSAPKKARRARVTKRVSSRSDRSQRSRVTLGLDHGLDYGDRESQPTPPARVQSDYPIPELQRVTQQPYNNVDQQIKPCFNAWPYQPYHTSTHPSKAVDYRDVKPRNEKEMSNIQIALSITTAGFDFYNVGGYPSTTRDQSYLYQVKELSDSFAAQWVSSGRDPFFMPSLQIHQGPWRNRIEDGLLSLDGNTFLGGMRSLDPGWDAFS